MSGQMLWKAPDGVGFIELLETFGSEGCGGSGEANVDYTVICVEQTFRFRRE